MRNIRKAVVISVFLLLFVSSLLVTNYKTIADVQSAYSTLYVGGSGLGNYTIVQAAVNNASYGDTVFVYNGIYYENIVIGESISLIGENKSSTFIDGNNNGIIVKITADRVSVSGFTIQNSGSNSKDAGIEVRSNHNIISSNNIFSKNHNGMSLSSSSNNTVIGNNISSNNHDGISLGSSSNNTIIGNNISNNYDGINLGSSSKGNIISSNNIFSNNYDGICFYFSSSNTIIGNNISSNNHDGIYLYSSSNNTIIGSSISLNKHYGIYLSSSNYNIICYNNLMDNALNAYDRSDNAWYDQNLMEGNYWDDYNGTDDDGDGIGDIPYNISSGENQDLYPLMELCDLTQYVSGDGNKKNGSNGEENIDNGTNNGAPGFEPAFAFLAIIVASMILLKRRK